MLHSSMMWHILEESKKLCYYYETNKEFMMLFQHLNVST